MFSFLLVPTQYLPSRRRRLLVTGPAKPLACCHATLVAMKGGDWRRERGGCGVCER